MRVFIVLYSDASDRHAADTVAVCSTRPLADQAMQKHAEGRELQGEWYIEEWDLDGEFIDQEQVYPQ